MATVAERYAIALEEARRGLDRQLADLDSLRHRATALLSMGGVLISVLGGFVAGERETMYSSTWVAVLAFVGMATASVVVLLPKRLDAAHDPSALLDAIRTPDASADDVDAHVAEQTGKQYDRNKSKLDHLVWAYVAAVVFFVVEVSALVLDLRGR